MRFPNMLLVGAAARNLGKTAFCVEFIRRWKSHFDVVAIKATTIHGKDGVCHRGDNGCGVCGTVAGDYEILEITGPPDGKDTGLLLGAGARAVYWLRVKEHALTDAALALSKLLPVDSLVVCESNSLARVVKPGALVLISGGGQIKPSARPLFETADITADITGSSSMALVIDKLTIMRTLDGTRVFVNRPS